MKFASRAALFGILFFGAILLSAAAQRSSKSPKQNRSAESKAAAETNAERAGRGLVAFYDFQNATGGVVKDRSGNNPPLDLRIAESKSVRRVAGALELRGKTTVRSDKPATRLVSAIRKSGEITIEAWVRPAKLDQTGPARMVTISKNANERNVTLGQDRNRFETRLRTTKTSKNGIPATTSPAGSLSARLMHVVYSRNRAGQARIHIDGKQRAQRRVAGTTSNWNGAFRLALGNELSGDRPWLGTFYLVAIYNRALSPKEIESNFKAGAGAGAAKLLAARRKRAQNARLFETRVAALLARRCLECHGWKSKKGKLDLSRKFAALRGGETGRVIVPGNAKESLLFQSVMSHDMPKNRQPLSDKEKQLLRVWIDGGANWPLEIIDESKFAIRRKPGAIWLRRLTVAEYAETVRVALGVNIAEEARKTLPRDLRADGFSNTAYNLNVDLAHVRAYAELARTIAARVDVGKLTAAHVSADVLAAARKEWNARTGTGNRKASAKRQSATRKLVAAIGKWLWRGPLNDHEIAGLLRVLDVVAKEKGKFDEAIRFVIEGMVQSPRFIYRVETQRGDGRSRLLGNHELASRLSYILWGGPPDKELFRAADAGELTHARHVETQVRRMLADPRAVARSARFIAEWLNLDRLDNLRPNAKHFPKWDSRLAGDMRAETLAFFKEVAWKRKRPLSELFNAQVAFVTPRLAKHYGMNLKSGTFRAASAGALQRVDVSGIKGRGGLLTQGSVLTIGGDEASMVTRGLFVLQKVLDGAVDDPPPSDVYLTGETLMKTPISRRTMLKGLGGATIALPLLEEMIVPATAAVPEPAAPPTRAFNVFFGLGIPAPLQTEGFSGVLEPLEPLSKKLLIMRNVDQVRCDERGINAHFDGASGAFTAEPPDGEAKSGGPSIDQVIRKAHYPKGLPPGMVPTLIGGTFFRRSRISRYVHSYNDNGTVAAAMKEKPRDLFERVFGTIDLPKTAADFRKQRIRRSVLDSVVGQYRYYTGQNSPLGAASRARVADHLDRIREYERRAFRLVDSGKTPKKPAPSKLRHGGDADPGGQGIDITLEQLTTEWRLMADLYALAIQTDRVRFGSLTFLAAGERIRLKGDYKYNGKTVFQFDDAKQHNASGDKGCSHEWWHKFREKKKNTQLRAHAHMKMREIAYFLQRLDGPDSKDANGKSILENSLITISTESGDGRHSNVKRELSGVFHAITGANGRFKTGRIMDVGAEGLDVYNTMLDAMNVARRLGPETRPTRPIDGIRA
eukprot:g10188.t1